MLKFGPVGVTRGLRYTLRAPISTSATGSQYLSLGRWSLCWRRRSGRRRGWLWGWALRLATGANSTAASARRRGCARVRAGVRARTMTHAHGGRAGDRRRRWRHRRWAWSFEASAAMYIGVRQGTLGAGNRRRSTSESREHLLQHLLSSFSHLLRRQVGSRLCQGLQQLTDEGCGRQQSQHREYTARRAGSHQHHAPMIRVGVVGSRPLLMPTLTSCLSVSRLRVRMTSRQP